MAQRVCPRRLGSHRPPGDALCPGGPAEHQASLLRRPCCLLLLSLPLSPAAEAASIAAGGGRETAGGRRRWFLFLTRLGCVRVSRDWVLQPGHPLRSGTRGRRDQLGEYAPEEVFQPELL